MRNFIIGIALIFCLGFSFIFGIGYLEKSLIHGQNQVQGSYVQKATTASINAITNPA